MVRRRPLTGGGGLPRQAFQAGSGDYTSSSVGIPQSLQGRFITICIGLLLAWAALAPIQLYAQCSSCTYTLTTNTSFGSTVNAPDVLCITGSGLTYSQNVDLNSATLCIGPGVTFTGGGNFNNNWTLNNYGTTNRAITVGPGQTFNNYGTYTGSLTINGGTVRNYSGGTLTASGMTYNSGTLQNDAGATATISVAFTMSAGTLTNNGTLNLSNAGTYTFNSGTNLNLNGVTTVTGAVTNNGTVTIGGRVGVSGAYNQGASGVTNATSSSVCNSLNVTGNIQGQGTYNGLNGLQLNKGLTPACPACLVNSPSTAPAATPTQMASATLSVSGLTINGTVANPGGATPPTSYIVLRRMGAAVSDVPLSYVTYSVGNVIGNSVVVAVNPITTTSFSDPNVLSNGCTSYNYAVYGVNSTGVCGTVNQTIGAGNRSAYTYASVGGSVTPATSSICAGSNSPLLTLGGNTGSVVRWESSANAAFTTPVTISNTATTYTSGALSANTWFRAVVNAGTGCSNVNSVASAITVNAYPVVAAITGSQMACVGGTTAFACATGGGVWSSSNTAVATVSGGTVTGVGAGTTNINYTVTTNGCATTVSRSVTVVAGPVGTPGTFGNGQWNAYVYNSTNYSNFAGSYATAAALNYNTTTDYANNAAPSSVSSYQGCQVPATAYSVRFQRTGIPAGVYQIGVASNDDGMDIIIDGVTVYTLASASATNRPNVWTGSLTSSSLVEIRYANISSTGSLNFSFTLLPSPTAATPGTISGNQQLCAGSPVLQTLASTAAATQGTCSISATPYQWQSSTDNVTFTNISGANATTYTIPGSLTQTTYYRRAYTTYCETVYSNTVTVTVYPGAMGTPGTFGTGQWNAYVYNSTNYTSYAGFYTTGSALNYSTTTDYATNAAPSLAPSYQGCNVPATAYSVRYLRTGLTAGVYQIGVGFNDDGMDIIIDGVTVYSLAGGNGSNRPNVWTGSLTSSSQVEIRYANTGSVGSLVFNMTLLPSPTAPTPGVVAGTQSVCATEVPTIGLTSTTNAAAGTCTLLPTPYQWESSTDNVTFTPIAGANATTYTIPYALGQTTYFRRAYRTYCETVYSNTLTVSVFNSTPGDPTVFGNGQWNAYVYSSTGFGNLGTYYGFYTDPTLSFNSATLWASGARPSNAVTYQGCLAPASNVGISLKRTNFAPGVYQIDIPTHDDGVILFINGVNVYQHNSCCDAHTNVWTGQLDASSTVEFQLFQGTGGSYISATFTLVPSPAALVAGTITGTQSVCSGQIPQQPITVATPASGGCSISSYQWQMSNDNIGYTDIPGATSATYSVTTALTDNTWFRRVVTDACGRTATSNFILITVDNTIYGDANIWGSNTWNAYSYSDYTFGTYSGFYTEPSLSFLSTNRFTTTQSPSWASGYKGCQIQNTNYSVIMRRLGAPALPSNQVYQIDLASLDDYGTFLIDSAVVFQRGCCVSPAAPITNIWTGPLDANSNLEFRWQGGGGGNYSGLTFTAVPKPTSINAGTIAGSTTICSGDIPAAGFSSASLPSAGCYVDYYRWQISTNSGSTWADLPNSNSTTYVPVQSIYGSPGSQTWFRRVVYDVCGNTAATSPVVVTIQNTTPGNPAVFGSNTWNVYAYDDQNFALYVGYYTEDNLSFNTRARYAATLPPSAAGATASGLAFQGCQQANSYWSFSAKRKGLGSNPAGYYSIDVNLQDDYLTLLVNGVQVWNRNQCCQVTPNVWTGYVDNNTTFEWRLVNFPGPGGLSFTFNYLGATAPGPIDPGTLSSAVTQFCPGDAYYVLSATPASGGCSPYYQWQSSPDGLSWTNIAGATAADLTSPDGLSSAMQFRRGAYDSCGNAIQYTTAVGLTVTAPPSLPTLVNNQWTALIYNATDFTSNYVGYYTETNLNLNTTLRHANTAPPSSANGTSGAAYYGCMTNSTNYSVRYVRTGFPAGTYSIDIPTHDDYVYVFVNGTNVFQHIGCCDAHTSAWTGVLGASSTVEIRYANFGGPGNVSAIFNLTTPTTPLNAGTISSDQTICYGANAAALTTAIAPSGSCSVNNYQWFSSPNNVTFTAITGATSANYTPTALTATTYFRRQAIDGCGATAMSNTITITVNPQVTAGTIGSAQSVCSGVAAATLNIATAPTGGNGTYTYQWQWSNNNTTFSNLGGATASSYSPTGQTIQRFYRLNVTSCGSTVSTPSVAISILPATAIATQPRSFVGCAGGTASFSVVANGNGLAYQWQVSSNSGGTWANVSSGTGGTTANYSVTIPGTISPVNSLQYRVIVTGTCATTSITSSAVMLNIGAPSFTTQPANQTVCSGSGATFTVVASGATTYQWQQDPATGTFSNMVGQTSATLTLSALTTASNAYRYRCVATNACSGTTNSSIATLTVQAAINTNTISGDQNVCSGGTGVALTVADPTAGGNGTYTFDWQSSTVSASGPFTSTGVTTSGFTPSGITQTTYYQRVVNSGSCSSTSGVVTATVAPTFAIGTQPSSLITCPGTTASFSVATTGSSVTYQWQENTGSGFANLSNGGVYSGVTTATLAISNASLGMSGYTYRCVVTGVGACASTSINSSAATLTTNILPNITVQPANVAWCSTAPLSVTLTATGNGLTYQWQRKAPADAGFTNITNGTSYANATTATLTVLAPTAAFNNYQFRCVVSNSCGVSVTSSASTLTMQSAIGFNSISSAQTICAGSVPVLLAGSAPTGGSGTYTYQWQEYTTVSGVWANTTGATASDYTPPALNTTTQYRRVVNSSNCNASTSPVIIMTVDQPPTVSAPPAATNTCANVSTTVAVTGTGNNISYQWQVSNNGGTSFVNCTNGTRYANATTATLQITAPPASFSGYQYRCVVTGDCGGASNSQVTSSVSTLFVNPGATVTAEPANNTICANGSTSYTFSYSLPAPGNLPLSFQWQERIGAGSYANIANGGVYAGVTTTTLSLTNVPASMTNRRYRCAIIYGGCVVYTSSVQGLLTVNNLPALVATASPSTICAGQSTTLSVAGATTYLWSTGSTASSLAVSPASTQTYTVTGTNAANGCTNTASVTVTVNPLLTPTVTIATPANPVCTGSSVTFTATPVNGGASPSYQWKVGGVNVGTNSASFTTSTLTNGQIVSCVMTSNAVCPSPATVTSNSITMGIDAVPTVTAGGAISNICESASPSAITLSGAGIGGTATTGAWSIQSGGGSLSSTSGTGSPATVTYTPAAGYAGSVVLQLTSNTVNSCPVVSATRTITVNTLPTASINYAGSPVCQSVGGTQAVSLVGNSGGLYSAGAGLSVNSSSGQVNVASSTAGDYTVTYTIAAANGCPVVTATAPISIRPNVGVPSTPSGPAAVCQGSSPATYYTTAATGATSYNWSVSGTGNSALGSGTSATVTWGSSYSGTALISVTANGCGGPSAPATLSVPVRVPGSWMGYSSDWQDANNWCGGVPTVSTDVNIPTGTAIMPQLNGSCFTRDLTIASGSSVTVLSGTTLTVAGSLTQNGTFSPQPGSTVSFTSSTPSTVPSADYGNLSTSGNGTKTLSGTIRISGTFSPSATAHVVTGSTIEFNGSSAQNIPGFTFNNLTTSGNSAKSLTGNVRVDGATTLTNGTLAIGANTLTVNGTVSGAGTMSGACTSQLLVGGTGSTGTLNFTAGSRILGTLGMQKAGSGDVTLGSSLDICSALTLTQGKVILGSNDLTLLAGATTTGASANSYVVTLDQMNPTGAGFFIQNLPTSGGARTFPVGTAGSYTPAYIANVGAARDMKVRVFNNVFENGISGPVIQNVEGAVKKTWEIEPTPGAGTPDVSIRLQWNPSDEGTYFPAARANSVLPYIGKNTGVGNSAWVPQLVSAYNYTSAPYTITTPSITSFSKFSVGSYMSPLPVQMGELEVAATRTENTLHWTTYSERDARGFEVLRSADGKHYERIAFVEAAGGDKTTHHYRLADKARPGRVYYKVRFVGRAEGDEAFTNVVTVQGEGGLSFSAYPNPVHDVLYLESDADVFSGTVEFRLTDLRGMKFDFQPKMTDDGMFSVDVSHLPVGIYVVERIEGNTRSMVRIVKE